MRKWIDLFESELKIGTHVFELDDCEILYHMDNENAHITSMEVPDELRGAGRAREGLATFLALVDERNLTCTLMAQKMGRGGLTTKQLERFYTSFGFETQPRLSKHESPRMVRPKAK